MAREKAPAASMGYHGSPQWGRRLTDPDDQQRVKTDCGTVGDDGIRRTRWTKSGNPVDEAQVQTNYLDQGYEIADKGYYLEMSMTQKDFLAKEKAAQALVIARSKPKGKVQTKDEVSGQVEDDQYGEPISTKDLMGTT